MGLLEPDVVREGLAPALAGPADRRALLLEPGAHVVRHPSVGTRVEAAGGSSECSGRVGRVQERRGAGAEQRDAGDRDGAAPCGRVFSWTINAVSSAIQTTLATPAANITSISAQQQPTQNTPWRAPRRRPPAVPRS
jgi:hypothetical protein